MIKMTEEMLDRAERVYDQHARSHGGTECFRMALEVALKAALELAEPEPAVTQADLAATMERRAAALEKAKEMTDALSTVPTNSRGYAADGAKAPSLTERMDAMLRLARFLTWETDQ